MRKAAQKARDFAARPPARVSFVPVPYKLIEEHRGGSKWSGYNYSTGGKDAIPFDDMEIGDIVVLVYSMRSHYQRGKPSTVTEDWHPAICVSAAEERTFEIYSGTGTAWRWKEANTKFKVFRVPYHWRQQVRALLGREFASRSDLEAAMVALTRAEQVTHA